MMLIQSAELRGNIVRGSVRKQWIVIIIVNHSNLVATQMIFETGEDKIAKFEMNDGEAWGYSEAQMVAAEPVERRPLGLGL